MYRQCLHEWIRRPDLLDVESLGELKALLSKYPYFQTARLLYVKNLYLLGHPDFESELGRCALFAADPAVLFNFIEGDRFELKKVCSVQEDGLSESGDRTLDLINGFLSGSPSDASGGLLPLSLPTSVDYTPVLSEDDEYTPSPPMQGQELIDRFIEGADTAAEVFPESSDETVGSDEVSREEISQENDEQFFTETLAKIYVRQHRYEKALDIIKKLDLKYQKKNAYFADQIRFLERLIINAKSK